MKNYRRLRASLYIDGAVATNSAQALHAAIWAMRMAAGDIQSDLLSQDDELFLKLAGPFMRWSKATMTSYLACFDSNPERRATLEAMTPSDAWLQLACEYDPEAMRLLRVFRMADPRKFHRMLRSSLSALELRLASSVDPIAKNIEMLRSLLDLTETECKLLHLAACSAQNALVQSALHGTRIVSSSDAFCLIGMLVQAPENEVAKALKAGAPLSYFRLVSIDRVAMTIGETIVLEDRLKQYLCEPHDSMEEMMRNFIVPASHGVLGEADCTHLADDLAALKRYLSGARAAGSRGVNILIYGKSGTGKTEFSRLLANTVGARLYEVASSTPEGFPVAPEERIESLKISQSFLARQGGANILFDEIEDVFSGRGATESGGSRRRLPPAGKAWMNRALETNEVPVIWVSNRIDQLDVAYLRRFSYHLEIRTPPVAVRRRIAQRYLENTPVSTGFIEQMNALATLVPGDFAVVRRQAALIGIDPDPEQFLAELEAECRIKPAGGNRPIGFLA